MQMFGKFGPIESAKLAIKEDGSCAGYGFVCFQDPAHAVAAIADLHNMAIAPEKVLHVCRAQKKAEREKELKRVWEEAKVARAGQHPPGCNLYIKNLPEDVTEEVLRAEFSKHGTITSAKIMTEPSGTFCGNYGLRYLCACLSSPCRA
jgi:polyadenylate-binding protein